MRLGNISPAAESIVFGPNQLEKELGWNSLSLCYKPSSYRETHQQHNLTGPEIVVPFLTAAVTIGHLYSLQESYFQPSNETLASFLSCLCSLNNGEVESEVGGIARSIETVGRNQKRRPRSCWLLTSIWGEVLENDKMENDGC